MKDMRRVLDVFEDYLHDDRALELVWTKHGVTVGLWSEKQNDWEEFVNCSDAKSLCGELCRNMAAFRQERLMQRKGSDLTDEEIQGICETVQLCWVECGYDPQDLSISAESDD